MKIAQLPVADGLDADFVEDPAALSHGQTHVTEGEMKGFVLNVRRYIRIEKDTALG